MADSWEVKTTLFPIKPITFIPYKAGLGRLFIDAGKKQIKHGLGGPEKNLPHNLVLKSAQILAF